MDILTPKTIPFLLVGVSAIYLVSYFRHRKQAGKSEQPAEHLAQKLAQRNRLRMAGIFGIVGIGQFLWKLFGNR